MDPYKNPFDVVETDDANKGTKQQERYQLSAGVGAQLTSKFAIGGKIDYQAANLAKMKDLRHVNKLLDINAAIGGLQHLGKVSIGVNYTYLRRIESVNFRTNGNTDQIYLSLVSFGSFYGRTERFDKSGYTNGEKTRPVANIGHGTSLQINVDINPSTKFLSEFSYQNKKGSYGLNGSADFALSEHEGTQFRYSGILSITNNNNQHILKVDAQLDNLTNWENIYRDATTPGGVTRTVYYGKSEMFLRDITSVSLGYTKFAKIINNHPAWTITADANYFRRQQSTTIYPFYRDQNLDSYQLSAGASRNIFKSRTRYSLGLKAAYGAGSGTEKIDGLLATPSSTQQSPYSTDLYLNQEFEYFTKPRASINIDFQYTRVAKNNLTPYLKVDYSFTKAFDTEYLGTSFGIFGATVGCNF